MSLLYHMDLSYSDSLWLSYVVIQFIWVTCCQPTNLSLRIRIYIIQTPVTYFKITYAKKQQNINTFNTHTKM